MLPDIKKHLAQSIATVCGLPTDQVIKSLEVPRQYEHGHLAWPVFQLAKEKKMPPPVIAQEIVGKFQQNKAQYPEIKNVQAAGGFVNFTFTPEYLQNTLFADIKNPEQILGYSKRGAGKTVLIDYSSPNVAKPMHVGHLRATVVGQAIRNLAETQGYKVVGINHLGDWGSQFGKLAWAYMNWGKEYDFSENPIDALLKLYVRFHDEAEKNPELEKAGAQTFKKLEDGDQEIQKVWRMIVDLSLKDYQRYYKILGVQHDLIRGESFYNDRLDSVVKALESKGLLQESEGAQVVFLGDDMPPCLIKKSDGASLYATRDIATALYRMEELKGDLNLYVVGVDQTLHFKQVFRVCEKMGYPWVKNCHHIAFGMYQFKEGKMSTRKGQIIRAEDILNQVIDRVRSIIDEKNPSLDNKELVAQQIGAGAVIFNDLINDRVKNVEFDIEKATSFDGDSGPYVQYMAVRCKSLIKKYAEKYGHEAPTQPTVVLETPEEQYLEFVLLQYEQVLMNAFDNFKPNYLAQYLLDVCKAFAQFYHKCRILGEPKDVEASRMALVGATEKVLVSGLGVLSIQSPDAM